MFGQYNVHGLLDRLVAFRLLECSMLDCKAARWLLIHSQDAERSLR
jgi:hypothetical protein